MNGRTRTWLLWNQNGIALPLAVIALVALGALAAALLSVGSSEVLIASNHLRGMEAHYLAEAGLEDAFNALRTNPGQVSNAPAGLTALAGLAGPGPTLANVGSYAVQYRAAGPDTVLVVSTATAAIGNAQRQLRVVLTTKYSSSDAILTEGDLMISGDPVVAGACGSAHTNSDFSISGDPTIPGDATASGTYSASGNPTIGGYSGGGQPQKYVPSVDPSAFLAAAKQSLLPNQIYQLKSDGQVLDGADNPIMTLASGSEFNGWKYLPGSPTKWDFGGNVGYDGVYYLEGSVTLQGNPGTPATPWLTTIIATGDIEVSGNPEILTLLTDTLFVTGLDMKINGNPNQNFTGLIAAHEQVGISGNPTITGYVVAEDAASTSGTITQNEVNGNPSLSYDCGLNPPLPAPLRILAWGR